MGKTKIDSSWVDSRQGLIPVELCGLDGQEGVSSYGIPIPAAPHFVLTCSFVHRSLLLEREDIERHPTITHLATGRRVSSCLESVEQARKMAVALEGLPIDWDAKPEEIIQAATRLPPALRRWLRDLCPKIGGR